MIRRLLVTLAAIAVSVNLFTDLQIARQTRATDFTGEWVNKAYDAAREIDRARIAILEANEATLPDLKGRLSELDERLADFPSQMEKVRRLERVTDKELLSPHASNPALQILREMQKDQEQSLRTRLKNDEDSNREAAASTITASAFDVVLIIFFIGILIYEQRRAAKIERSLSGTISHLDSLNQSLKISLAGQHATFRTAVHDLKNPLGSIKGFAELIHEDPSQTGSVTEMSDIIHRLSNNTLSLVNSVLSQGHESQNTERFNLSAALKDVCMFLDPIAQKKKQRIFMTKGLPDYFIDGNRQQILDVLYNIVGNALKFSPTNTNVWMDCLEEDGHISVRIRDEGPGFKKDDFEKMFIPGASLSAKPTGDEVSTGLGLASARQTIEAHGGQITVQNNPTLGASVIIRLPKDRDLSSPT